MKEYWSGLTSSQKTKLILKVVIGLFALIFAIRNWQSVQVILVFFKMELPLTLIIVLCIAVGFVTSSLFDHRKFKLKNKEIAELKAKLAAQKELMNQQTIN